MNRSILFTGLYFFVACGVVHEQSVTTNANGNNLKSSETILTSAQNVSQAISNLNPEDLSALLKAGVDLKHLDLLSGRTFLHEAVLVGAIDLIELLMLFGADPLAKDKIGNLPKDIIPESTNLTDKTFKSEISDVLSGKSIMQGRLDSLMIESIQSNNPPRLRYLVKRGANVNFLTGTGRRKASVLVLAINSQNLELVRALVDDLKTDLESDFGTGVTPLKKAQSLGNALIVSYLVAKIEQRKNINNIK